jgi:tetratricopeptide (TPR) repeat protein
MRFDDVMMTAAELAARRRKRKRLVVVVSLVVLLLLGGLFGARPLLHVGKAWQARRHARTAMGLIEKEQWNDARKEATAAYQLWPNEPEAIRSVARFLSRTRQAQALEFWDRLEIQGRLTREDLVDEASIGLFAGDDTRAKRAITALLSGKNGAPKAVDHLLEAQLAMRQGAPIEAHDALQKVFGDVASTTREKLQAALLQAAIAGGNDAWRDEAWGQLKAIANENDAAGLDALTVLAQTVIGQESLPANFPMQAPELAQKLDAHPLARTPQKLLAIDLRIREQKEARAEFIAQATERWKDGTAEEMAALATWLNGKSEFQRLLDAIPLEKAILSRDLFLQQLDALGGLGRWKEIKEVVDRDTFPLDPVLQKMYLARCNAQLGEKTASENNWQRALEEAHGEPTKLLMLASYAEKNNAIETARAAYEEAIAEAPKLRAAHQGRLRIAQATRETKKIHDVLAEMLTIWPNDPAVQNDEGYTRLLLIIGGTAAVPSTQQSPRSEDGSQRSEPTTNNEELITIEQMAAKLVQREPSSLPHRTLLALARLQLGKFSDAMDAYSNIQVSRGALTHPALAVHAAVLAANGRADDAANEAREIDSKQLLPEEAALIAAIPR